MSKYKLYGIYGIEKVTQKGERIFNYYYSRHCFPVFTIFHNIIGEFHLQSAQVPHLCSATFENNINVAKNSNRWVMRLAHINLNCGFASLCFRSQQRNDALSGKISFNSQWDLSLYIIQLSMRYATLYENIYSQLHWSSII